MSATVSIPVTEATPAQIDREIVELSWQLAVAQARLSGLRNAQERQSAPGYRGPVVQGIEVTIRAQVERVAELAERLAPLHAEYDARPWDRYFLVTDGHLHYDISGHRCSRISTTEHHLIAQLSGLAGWEAIEAAGERVCTTCFPQAPVAVQGRKGVLLTRTEREREEARQERDAKQRATAQAKADKAITDVDGSTLVDRHGEKVLTEARAQALYRDAAVDVILYTDVAEYALCRGAHQTVEEHEAHRVELLARAEAQAAVMVAALAAKHGITVEEEIARHAKPVATKARKHIKEGREYREAPQNRRWFAAAAS